MKTNNINGLHSPKNRFSAEINFVKALKEPGTTGKRAYLVRMWCDGDFAYVWNIGDVEDGGWGGPITPEEDALTYQEAVNLIDELETYAADKGYVNITFDTQKL